MASRTPAAEIGVTTGLVRRLMRAQHPDLAGLPIEPVAAGWDNDTFRLGTDLAVRLPRREQAVPLLVNEQRWLPRVASHLPLPVPVPRRLGRPGEGYPWPWGVVPWIDGAPADLAGPDPDTSEELGTFLRALHRPAERSAPRNPARGVPLAARSVDVLRRLRVVGDHVDAGRLERVWRRAARLPGPQVACWIHGDLHPRNVLVLGGRVSGVIDWGDMGAGDPATDLMAAWALYDAPERAALLAAYGRRESALIGRARGWALMIGVSLLDIGLHDGDAPFERVGRRMLERVLVED